LQLYRILLTLKIYIYNGHRHAVNIIKMLPTAHLQTTNNKQIQALIHWSVTRIYAVLSLAAFSEQTVHLHAFIFLAYYFVVWKFMSSRRRIWKWLSSGMLLRVVRKKLTSVSDVFAVSIIRAMSNSPIWYTTCNNILLMTKCVTFYFVFRNDVISENVLLYKFC
jgi:hypothetical protein